MLREACWASRPSSPCFWRKSRRRCTEAVTSARDLPLCPQNADGPSKLRMSLSTLYYRFWPTDVPAVRPDVSIPAALGRPQDRPRCAVGLRDGKAQRRRRASHGLRTQLTRPLVGLRLGLDALLIVGKETALVRHEVERVFVHEDHEVRQAISLGDGRMIILSIIRLASPSAPWGPWNREYGPCRLGSQGAILTDAIGPPLPQENPVVVWKWISVAQRLVEFFDQFALAADVETFWYIQIGNGHHFSPG